MNVPEYLADGAWETVRRLLSTLFRLLIDTGGQSVGIRFGVATLTFTASATSAVTTVDHGLARTPQTILVFPVSAASWFVTRYVSGSRNETSFQIDGRTVDGTTPTITPSVFWFVVG